MSVCLSWLSVSQNSIFSVINSPTQQQRQTWNGMKPKKKADEHDNGSEQKKKKCFINSNHRHHHLFGLYQNTAQEKPGYSLLSFRPNGKSLPNSEVNPITHTHIQIMYGKMGFFFVLFCLLACASFSNNFWWLYDGNHIRMASTHVATIIIITATTQSVIGN